ncbi:Na+/H+ antiporter subunit B [Marivirga sp.]|jgi:multicomponent Na+:H+ antiporter subunit B|uniref:Na+/H+ antiporter subunit B n=1 Tax=Marivirga sp. TaxID=2018662 RepID=UPI003DA77E88
MNSFILKNSARIIVPFMLLFSVFLLFRGHNLPGGGFIGGLMAGAAFILDAFAYDVVHSLRKLRIPPTKIMASGLLLAVFSGLIGLISGDGFFKGYWLNIDIAFLPKLGTPVLFDIGVYALVLGMILELVLPNIKND